MNLREKHTQTRIGILSAFILSIITYLMSKNSSIVICALAYYHCFFERMVPKIVVFLLDHKPLGKIDVIESFSSVLFLVIIFISNMLSETICTYFSIKIQFIFVLSILFLLLLACFSLLYANQLRKVEREQNKD